MTSKSSFFDLLREDFRRRIWSFAISTLIFFFLFPVSTALRIASVQDPDFFSHIKDPSVLQLFRTRSVWLYFTQLNAPSGNGWTGIVLLGLAALMSVSGFSYLFRKQDVDFYHSLPVRRRTLFTISVVSSLLMTAIPWLVWDTLAGIFVLSYTGRLYSAVTVLAGFAVGMGHFFLCLMVCVTALMLTGTVPTALIAEAIFLLYVPACVWLADGYASNFLKTYWGDGELIWKIVNHGSPAAYLFAQRGLSALPWCIGVGLLFGFLACFLYEKRPSEAAGHAIAFRKTEGVIKFLVVILCALVGGIFVYSIQSGFAWAVFGVLCGLFLSSCAIEIIFRSDFRRLFDRKLITAACGVLSLLILAGFAFDLTGYDRYIPSEDSLTGAGISAYMVDNPSQYRSEIVPTENEYTGEIYYNYTYGTDEREILKAMNITDKDLILSLARECTSWNEKRPYESEPATVRFCYHLADGRDVFRSCRVDSQKAAALFDRLNDCEAYRLGTYPILSFDESDLSGVNLHLPQGFVHVNFGSREQMTELFGTYVREFASLSAATRRKEAPVADIQFKTYDFQVLADEARNRQIDLHAFNQVGCYPVYPSFTETIRLLKACGFDLTDPFPAEDISQIALYCQMNGYSGEQVVTITDPAEIREIMQNAWCTDLRCQNGMLPMFYGINIQVSGTAPKEFSPEDYQLGQNGIYSTYSFFRDRIPGFVLERLNLTEEDIQNYMAY